MIKKEDMLKNLKRSLELEDDLEGDGSDGVEGGRKFYGVTVGTVINPVDLITLGRVQVQLPFIDSLDLSPWARIAVPMAGIFHGDYFIPNPGDQVLVAFEHGDINAPIIIGSLWNIAALPPLPTPLPQIRAIRTLAGNQVVFTEVPPSVTIQTGPTPPEVVPMPPTPAGPPTIMMSPAGIQIMSPTTITLQVGTNSIIITPASITLQVGDSGIALTPALIGIIASNLSLTGTGNVGIFGAMVRINS